MKKELFETLSKYEKELNYAVKLNFMHLGNGDFNTLMEVYKELYGSTLNRSQMNCSTCRLSALKKLGKDYFNEKEIRKNAEKPKRGRPRKIDEKLTENDGNEKTEGTTAKE